MSKVSRTTPEALRGVYTCAGVYSDDVSAIVTAWAADGRIELEIRDAAASITLLRATFRPEIPGGRFIISTRPGMSVEQ